MDRAVEVARSAAERHGWDLVPSGEGDELSPSLFIVLGGDGTILHALRASLDGQVPVFGINFGRVGFLAGVEADQIELGLDRAEAKHTGRHRSEIAAGNCD